MTWKKYVPVLRVTVDKGIDNQEVIRIIRGRNGDGA